MASPIMAGAEPFTADGGPHGALVLHGFTGSPGSMRGIAEALAGAGFAVDLPLLPGHGTSVDDMIPTGWDDWLTAAEAGYATLARRCQRVVITGLSMGGALTLALAAAHPEVAGIACVNPVVQVPDEMRDGLQAVLDAGTELIDGIGNDIAKPGEVELAYDKTPLRPMLSMIDAASRFGDSLGAVACPVLLLTSPQDHVVDPSNSDAVADKVSGPVERITLERSFHVATQDFDRDLIESSIVAFASRVCGG